MLSDDLIAIRDVLRQCAAQGRDEALQRIDAHIDTLLAQKSPPDYGAALFMRIILPQALHTLRLSPESLAQFYAGLFLSMMGAMSAQFGPEQSIRLIREILEAATPDASIDPGVALH